MSSFMLFRTGLLASLGLVFGLAVPESRGQTFSNATPIVIPDEGPGNPYPSTINVSGVGNIGYLQVTLRNLSHTFMSDLSVMLVSPAGQRVLLMNQAGALPNPGEYRTYVFVPDGASVMPGINQPPSGTYLCTSYLDLRQFPAPAPAGPAAISLLPLLGTPADGPWSLFVFDAVGGDSGAIAGGWSLTFLSAAPPIPATSSFTYQGVLASGGVPISGNANVRFTLHNREALSLPVAAPITRSFTDITGGLITTSLDFGNAMDTTQALWLGIEVDSPPGSGFVALSPRQAISPAPQARIAINNWALKGNAATNPASDFIGTIDNAPLVLRSNGRRGLQIQSATSGPFDSMNMLGGADVNSIGGGVIGATVAGGGGRSTSGDLFPNTVLGDFGSIGGGVSNTASGRVSTVSGGTANASSGDRSWVGGGDSNTASGEISAVAGGGNNIASGRAAFIGGGSSNLASGEGAAVPGGFFNTASGIVSFAAGNRAKANHLGTFAWADATDADFASTNNNQFIIRASGGVGIGTASPLSALHVAHGPVGTGGTANWGVRIENTAQATFRTGMRISDDGFFDVTNRIGGSAFARLSSNGTWSAVSDARLKTDITTAEGNLDAALKLRPVNFRWKEGGEPDFGLIAQEVREALPTLVLGDERTGTLTLNYSQLSVVAIGAIQELKADNDRKQREIDQLKARLERLEKALETLTTEK